MEQQKLANNKETLVFLNSKYPKCFFLEGKVKPLKIGIFQDLAEDLASEEAVSKRLLRTCLRHYTSSWRYLASIKEGVARVNLHGEEGDLIEAEHAEHAQQQLKESKQKAAKLREEKNKAQKVVAGQNKSDSTSQKTETKVNRDSKKFKKHYSSKTNTPRHNKTQHASATKSTVFKADKQLESNDLAIGKKALVKLGKEPMPVEIVDISKDGVSVQLKSGMTVKVQQSQLYSLETTAK